MTRERAIELRRAQSQFPYWGNYRRFMTADEIAEIEDLWSKADGNASFASIICRIASGKE